MDFQEKSYPLASYLFWLQWFNGQFHVELQWTSGLQKNQTTNDETKVVACDTMHPACSEENLIMFCCRLVRLGWTGTGDGPAWLTESEHRKFVGESPSPTSHQTSFCITDFTPGESWNWRFCCEKDLSVLLKVLTKFAPSQFCGRNRGIWGISPCHFLITIWILMASHPKRPKARFFKSWSSGHRVNSSTQTSWWPGITWAAWDRWWFIKSRSFSQISWTIRSRLLDP